jgi:integrase
MGTLKASELDALPQGKKHHDGDGLYFDKKVRGASWIYKFTLHGQAREMGLGKYPEIGLTKARELAGKARALRAEGKDPIREREAAKRLGITFEEAAREYWRVHCQNRARPNDWIRGMEINVFPHIGKKAVVSLSPPDIIKFMKPIWGLEKTRKLRQWINAVIGFVSADDPRVDREIMNRVASALGPQNITYENLAAIPWNAVPDLWCALPPTLVGLSMKMLVLTGLRVRPVILADWSEFDFTENVWTVPPGRVKGWKYRYRVPLTRAMVETLNEAGRRWGKSGLVFPSAESKSGHLSNNAHRLWLHDHEWKDENGELATAHGLRSAVRTWMHDRKPPVDFRLSEHILQHMGSLGSQTEQAYLRSDALDHRREVLEEWSEFVVSKEVARAESKREDALQERDIRGLLRQGETAMTPREAAKWARYDGLEGEVDVSQPADD